jgi:signal transduction histidine kinase
MTESNRRRNEAPTRERRLFRRHSTTTPVIIHIGGESHSRRLHGKAINIGNGGTLVELDVPADDLSQGVLAQVDIPISTLWGLKEEAAVIAPCEILRIGTSAKSKQKALVALRFYLFTPPNRITMESKSAMIDYLWRTSNQSPSINYFLKKLLRLIIKITNSTGAIYFVRNDSSLPINESSAINNEIPVVEFVPRIREGIPEEKHLPIFKPDYAPETDETRFKSDVAKYMRTLWKKEVFNTVGIPIREGDRITSAVLLVIPHGIEVTRLDDEIKDLLIEANRIIDAILDKKLRQEIGRINEVASKVIGGWNENISELIEETRQLLACAGLSVFVRDYSYKETAYPLVATAPQRMPEVPKVYYLSNSNMTSRALLGKTSCVAHNVTTRRKNSLTLQTSIWRDVSEDEPSNSVQYIPTIIDDNVVGLLRCTNKVGTEGSPYFDRIDTKRSEVLAPLLMNWLIVARKEGSFTSSLLDVSHEIKQSMGGILSAAIYIENDISRNNSKKREEQLHKLKHIKNTVKSLKDFLPGLSRKERSALATDEHTCNSTEDGFLPYAELCKPICESYMSNAKRRNIQIEITGQDQLGRIYSSRDTLQHIVRNLLDNAVKYTKEGKKITIKFQHPAQGDPCAEIHILSESIPINEDEKEMIFLPGYRAESAKKEQYSGEGRGLVIARAMARGLGGDIILNSAQGFNIFSILIPKSLFYQQGK